MCVQKVTEGGEGVSEGVASRSMVCMCAYKRSQKEGKVSVKVLHPGQRCACVRRKGHRRRGRCQ